MEPNLQNWISKFGLIYGHLNNLDSRMNSIQPIYEVLCSLSSKSFFETGPVSFVPNPFVNPIVLSLHLQDFLLNVLNKVRLTFSQLFYIWNWDTECQRSFFSYWPSAIAIVLNPIVILTVLSMRSQGQLILFTKPAKYFALFTSHSMSESETHTSPRRKKEAASVTLIP